MLSRAIVRSRGAVAAVWVLLAVALVPWALTAANHMNASARPNEREAGVVERILAKRFDAPYASFAVLVISNIASPATPEGKTALHQIVSVLDTLPGVKRVLSFANTPDSAFLSPRGTFVVVGLDKVGNPAQEYIPAMRHASAVLQQELAPQFPGISMGWTGDAPFNYDVRAASAADARTAERRVLPITIVLLVVVFGSLVAALLPAIAGALAIGLSLGGAALISMVWPLSVLSHNIITMLGLGIGVDYALLTVSRFRESLAQGLSAEDAAIEAVRRAGHTILISGAAVAIGFVALIVIPIGDLRSIGIGGLLTVVFSALIATTLLPGLLAWLGPLVNRWSLWHVRHVGRENGWRKWGAWVAAHPLLVIVVCGVPLAILVGQARRLNDQLPTGEDWLPQSMESARAVRAMRNMGKMGIVEDTHILLELPPGAGPFTDAGWQAWRRVAIAVEHRPEIARVRSLPTILHAEHPSTTVLGLVSVDLIRSFVSRDHKAALIEVVPKESATPAQLTDLIHELRAMDPVQLTGLRGATIRIGGLPAQNTDYQDAIAGHAMYVVGLVVGGTFFALLIGFSSVLIPLKAIVLNLISVGAAFGATVLVFQDGHLMSLVGLSAPVDALFPAVPVIVFCLVFGLSMDYEVFLVARVAEANRSGAGVDDALAEGVARTGGVITSAAAVMIVVFASFTLGDFLLVKILGFALAVAVLVDATIVRLGIGPAVLRLAGKWNWWPGQRGLPSVMVRPEEV
ncbi:MAG TPA: MMPL family transporter [Gemmatimonadaceae bacterium]|nr:MMPL family transporter [Gemmatimonadaceae bacterium]